MYSRDMVRHMKKSFLVIGMGRFGKSVAVELKKLGNEVLAVDEKEENFSEIDDYVSGTVLADCRDEESLRALNVEDFDAVVLSIASDVETSILTAVLLKELGAKYLMAKAQSDLHAKVLLKVGADKIILPEHDMAIRVAHALNHPTFMDVMSFGDALGIVEMRCPAGWANKSLKELNLNKKYKINIIAARNETRVSAPLDGDYVLSSEDMILMIGATDVFSKLG